MIAEKAHSEILSMKNRPRSRWYRTILPEEKAVVMGILEAIRRRKTSDFLKEYYKTHEHPSKNKKRSAEAIQKTAEATRRRWQDPDYHERVCKKLRGRTRSEEYRRNISRVHRGMKHSEETLQAISGENHHNWQGGSSFEPYCPKFNDTKKEEIRNKDNRVCQLCGKSEIHNGQRLSVHHIDSNKVQGCNGVPWYLCSLCRSCNGKKDTIEKEFLIVTRAAVVEA